ncbi:unnamed protein product [Rhizophagus irregularis]|nr:unnamed protein product [Rhizophagus irregularis]
MKLRHVLTTQYWFTWKLTYIQIIKDVHLYLKKRPFYGNIEYYLMYEFNNEKSMLAYINWTASVSTD